MREWLKKHNPKTPQTDDKWESAMAWNVFMIEKECAQRIDENYPLMKFFSLLENLKLHIDKEKREMERARK